MGRLRRRTILAIFTAAALVLGLCLPVFPASRVRMVGLHREFGVISRGMKLTSLVSITNYSVYPVSVYMGNGCSCEHLRMPDAVVTPAGTAQVTVTYETVACTPGTYQKLLPISIASFGCSWKEVASALFTIK